MYHSAQPVSQGLMGRAAFLLKSLTQLQPIGSRGSRLSRVQPVVFNPGTRQCSPQKRQLVVSRHDAPHVTLKVLKRAEPPDAREQVAGGILF